MARHSRPTAAAAAALLMASLTSADYINVAPNGRSGDGWGASGDGCNQAGGDCQPVVYDDIQAEVGMSSYTPCSTLPAVPRRLPHYQQFHDVFLHDSVDAGMACNMGSGSRVGAANVGSRTDGDRVGF